MPLIPTPHSVAHIPRAIEGPNDPDTGNPRLISQPLVVRKVQSINQIGRHGSSHEVISPDYVQRADTTLHIAVPDPTLYHEHDQVILGGQFSGGDYVAGTGVAFWVDGDPTNDKLGPWPRLLQQFGGLVKLKRIT